MKPHRKPDRTPPDLDRDGEPCERVKPRQRRRRDALRYQNSGFYTEYWDDKRGTWRVATYFRDRDCMIRSYRGARPPWDSRPLRMRYPGDGKSSAAPEFLRFTKPLTVPDPPEAPEPVSDRFRERVSAAIDKGLPVKLVYRDRSDAKTVRTVRPLSWVEGDRFTAYCELRGEERDFRVHRILDCQMAAG